MSVRPVCHARFESIRINLTPGFTVRLVVHVAGCVLEVGYERRQREREEVGLR